MRLMLLLPLLLSACSKPADEDAATPARAASPLVGLYERAGVPDEPSRLCIVGDGGSLRFGLRSSYEGPESCTMEGRIEAAGARLTLRIDGAPACALSATVAEDGIELGEPRGAECSYYCGRNTTLDRGRFARVGTGEAAARRAVDIAGEPLC